MSNMEQTRLQCATNLTESKLGSRTERSHDLQRCGLYRRINGNSVGLEMAIPDRRRGLNRQNANENRASGNAPSRTPYQSRAAQVQQRLGRLFFHFNICTAFPRMPKYFFNVHHERSTIDEEGEELPDRHEAWRAATLAAGEMIKGIDGKLVPGREWRLAVTDEFRNPLYVIHVSAEKSK
jgi:hypothetical protein